MDAEQLPVMGDEGYEAAVREAERRQRRRRTLIVVLAVVLTPVAAFICGFGCCLATLTVTGGGGLGGLDKGFAAFILGGLLTAAGVAYAFFRAWERTRYNGPDRSHLDRDES